MLNPESHLPTYGKPLLRWAARPAGPQTESLIDEAIAAVRCGKTIGIHAETREAAVQLTAALDKVFAQLNLPMASVFVEPPPIYDIANRCPSCSSIAPGKCGHLAAWCDRRADWIRNMP